MMQGEKPYIEFEPEGFADAWWKFQRRQSAFEEYLLWLGDEGFDFEKTWTDDYDSSIEIGGVPPNARLNEDQQKFLFSCGFVTAFVNHEDGVETHYSLKEISAGWRRKRKDGGFIVNRLPKGWVGKRWVKSGYISIDPNL